MRAKRKFDIRVKGHRYWGVLVRHPYHPEKIGLLFYSDHKWPFYHASYFPDRIDPDDCWQQFMEFIPCKYEAK